MTSVRTAAITQNHAREIIRHVTGRTPGSVEVEPEGVLSYFFRERCDDDMHCYIFEGDGSTARDEWREALQEVCCEDGCREIIDPKAPTVRNTKNPTAPECRLCSRHIMKGRTVHLDCP